eukprot:Blabericola_migrator_1__5625@NODE_285_length_10382_cov_182_229956_g235_i0_p2_GENE_NODE_285_length_10382_cov_182_229956_g235_i0NODE_285_length_10382_cov_182_229956_g235_i0_p2_ORF_typecomplete_len493_score65_16Exo_endo_phos/PF03372_23/1_4e26_NODE_285_length_10382_cov_182_229956_g235_i048486326
MSGLHDNQTDGTNALTLLTFNAGLLKYRFLGLTLLRNPPFTNRRLRHMPIALRAANADIVALQEVFDDRHADFLIESLRLIYPFSARRASGGMLALHNGLLTLSKFPIVRTDFHKFKNITWFESLLGSKGLLETVINVPGVGLISVLNAHMVSGIDPESPKLDSLRAQETQESLTLAAAAAKRGEIPILLGDFNAAPTVCPASYNVLIHEEWEDAFLSGSNQSGSVLPTSYEAREDSYDKLDDIGPPVKCRKHRRDRWSRSPARLSSLTDHSTRSIFDSRRKAPFGSKIHYSQLSFGEEDLGLTLEEKSVCDGEDCSTCDSVEDMISKNLDASEKRIWTWDPSNALNLLGPHSACHGLRCDHIFLPPYRWRGDLSNFTVTESQILFHQPRVLIHSKWLTTCLVAPLAKCFRSSPGIPSPVDTAPLLVTLSDHNAVKIQLIRFGVPPVRTSTMMSGNTADETVLTHEILSGGTLSVEGLHNTSDFISDTDILQ